MFRTLVADTAATDGDRFRRLIASQAVSGARDFPTFLISGPATLRPRRPTPAVANPVRRGPFGRGLGCWNQAGGRMRALSKRIPGVTVSQARRRRLGHYSALPVRTRISPIPVRWGLQLSFALALLCGGAGIAAAADQRWPAWYVMPRVGTAVLLDTEPASGVKASSIQQSTGLSVGVDVGRHFGIELAGDAFETNLKSGGRTIGEYGIFNLIPQLRVRVPIGETRLTPYALAGVGASFAEFNDRKKTGIGRRIRGNDTALVGALGGGIDYAISRDVSAGVEVRYLASRGHEITIGEDGGRASLDAVIAGATLRVLLEPDAPTIPVTRASEDATRFLHLVFRVGGASATRSRIASGVEARPENAAIAGRLNLLFGAGVGADINRHLGLELVADGYEYVLDVPGIGTAGEYAIYTVVPQVRARYPLFADRLVPYAIAGIGISYAEFNDRKPHGITSQLRGTDYGAVGTAGAGIEWFFSTALAFGLEAKYQHFIGGHELRMAGQASDSRPHAVLSTAAVRVYFGRRPW
jgi:opacity protein-like surface antigen